MRTFIALDLSNQELKRTISSVQQRIVRTGASMRVVDPENIHFTLRFLGEVDQALLGEIRSRLRRLKTTVFSAKFIGLGAFPGSGRISVIWIGVNEESGKMMKDLAKGINESLDGLPCKNDTRPFMPHLTVARVKGGLMLDNLREIIHAESSQYFGEDEFGQLKLKKSDITPQGPIYSDLEVIDL